MDFHEVQFPPSLSFGSLGGPERRVDIVALANGFEERNTPWAHSRRRYDAGLGMRSLDDLHALTEFFEARYGQMFGFRWKDWSDFKSCQPSRQIAFNDQRIAIGDGNTSVFPLKKNYVSGAHRYVRVISKPVLGTVRIGVEQDELQEGLDYTVDHDRGEVTFSHPPDPDMEVTAGYEFDVPVRFDAALIQVSVASFNAGEVPSVPVIEVRV